MKRIISIRPKSEDPLKREQFIRGNDRTVQNKIINIINKDCNGNYDFLIDEDGNKYIQNTNDLLGEVLNIIDTKFIVEFTEEEDGSSLILVSHNESLPQDHTINQLKMIRKKSRGTDIGDKIANIENSANIQYLRNPIDTGIESTQDYERSNKKFEPNWNLKRMKPFKTYFYDQSTSNTTHNKRIKK